MSSWSDTGDLAERLAEEEDPLQIRLQRLSDEARPSDRQQPRHQRRVRYKEDDVLKKHNPHPGFVKEDLEIPTPRERTPSLPERIVAAIMFPGSREGQLHGLTGKPLLYARLDC